MGLFDWFRKDKGVKPGSSAERDEQGKWVIREPEVGIVVPEEVEVKAPAKKAPAKKPVAKTTEKKQAIAKDLADTPVAKPKPKAKPKTTPKKK